MAFRRVKSENLLNKGTINMDHNGVPDKSARTTTGHHIEVPPIRKISSTNRFPDKENLDTIDLNLKPGTYKLLVQANDHKPISITLSSCDGMEDGPEEPLYYGSKSISSPVIYRKFMNKILRRGHGRTDLVAMERNVTKWKNKYRST